MWSHTELNDFTNPEPFLYNNGNGGPGGLNLLNVGAGGETITFTISMGAPTIELDQSSILFEMAPNEFQSKNIVLSNGGDLETLLMFNISSVSLPFSNPVSGPDGGGYYWTSSENDENLGLDFHHFQMTSNSTCLLYTSPSPRDLSTSRMPSSA